MRRVRDRIGRRRHDHGTPIEGTRTFGPARRIGWRLAGRDLLISARCGDDRPPDRSGSADPRAGWDDAGLVGRLRTARGVGSRSPSLARRLGLADRPLRPHVELLTGMSHPRDPRSHDGVDRSIRESSWIPDPDRRTRHDLLVLAASPAPLPRSARAGCPEGPGARGVSVRNRHADPARAERAEGRAGRDQNHVGTTAHRSAEHRGPRVWRDRERPHAAGIRRPRGAGQRSGRGRQVLHGSSEGGRRRRQGRSRSRRDLSPSRVLAQPPGTIPSGRPALTRVPAPRRTAQRVPAIPSRVRDAGTRGRRPPRSPPARE